MYISAINFLSEETIKHVLRIEIPLYLKKHACNQFVLPGKTYGSDTLTLRVATVKKLKEEHGEVDAWFNPETPHTK